MTAAAHGPDPLGASAALPPREAGDTLTYLYAVGRAGADLAAGAAAAGEHGVAGTPVRVVAAGGLAALVCSVPAARFGEEGIRAILADLERLEAMARAHHLVVATACRTACVLPMRLATVYAGDDRVAGVLRERAAEFDRLLSRLAGRSEWGVKVYADPGRAAAPAPQPNGDGPVSPGRAYLRQRREQRDGRRRSFADAEALATRVLGRAGALAADHVAHRPQGASADGHGENIAKHAFLVPADRGAEFRAAVLDAAADTPGVRVEVTGPWAPYSFAVTDDAMTDGAMTDDAGAREGGARDAG